MVDTFFLNAVNKLIYINSEQGISKTVSVTIKGKLSDGQTEGEASFDVIFQDIEIGIFAIEETENAQ